MKKIVEFENCFLCKSCINKCPKNAIFLEEEKKCSFPVIDEKKCVSCKLCERVCPSKNNHFEFRKPLNNYIGQTKNDILLSNSSSGGIFSELAKEFIKSGGVVFGASISENGMKVEHIEINAIEELHKLQGSKYVQSDINSSYKKVEKLLKQNIKVLFTGTPCQIAGLKKYVNGYDDNLITLDIVCHGTPQSSLFADYLKKFETKNKCKIIEFKFRDKKYSWGHRGIIKYKKNGKYKEKIIDKNNCSYYFFFSNALMQKEACYKCPFAKYDRISDITLGDYWGIEKYQPKKQYKEGISLILINSQNGKKLFKLITNKIVYEEIQEDAAKHNNGQLHASIIKQKETDILMEKYVAEGYEYLEKYFYKKNILNIRYYISPKVIVSLKKIINKVRRK